MFPADARVLEPVSLTTGFQVSDFLKLINRLRLKVESDAKAMYPAKPSEVTKPVKARARTVISVDMLYVTFDPQLFQVNDRMCIPRKHYARP